MHSLRIRGANVNFQGKGLTDIPARVDPNGIHYTAWEPTAEEITKLQNGGRVIVACLGTQPYMVVRAIETDLVYEDYLTPYKPITSHDEPEWPHVEAAKVENTETIVKKRGRPKKIRKEAE